MAALHINHWGDGGLFPKEGAILALIMETTLPCFSFRNRAPEILVELRALFPGGEEIGIFPKDFLLRVASEFLKGRIHILYRSLAIGDHDHAVALVDRNAETLKLFFMLTKLGDIALHSHESLQYPIPAPLGYDFQTDQILPAFLGIIYEFLIDPPPCIQGFPNAYGSLRIC